VPQRKLAGDTEAVNVLSILYHDVTDPGDDNSSGFPGPAAARYKLAWPDFEEHLKAINTVLKSVPLAVSRALAGSPQEPKLLLTFDDGGISSLRIAEYLQRLGWLAHFFISTDYIGRPGFLTAGDILQLSRNGHVIGSHSCSHPRRMSSCPWEQLVREWKQSADLLAQITGRPITIASVPGGNYSQRVGWAAAEAGISVLFTSEPTTRLSTAHRCRVLGRYGIVRGMSAATAANLAAGRFLPCLRQSIAWKSKMVLKSAAGSYYDRFRDLCFGERDLVRGRM
jgi:peptidoglycan/xylan/chitin deacetylase (PgdA/CDA1 family)